MSTGKFELFWYIILRTDAEIHLVRKEGGVVMWGCEDSGDSPRLTSIYDVGRNIIRLLSNRGRRNREQGSLLISYSVKMF